MKTLGYYKSRKIQKNAETGNYYIKSPVNGTLRIFRTLKLLRQYVDNYEVLESHASALANNPW